MRKILVFLLASVLLVSLSGCIKPESEASSVADMETRQAVYDLTRETAQEVNANSDFGGYKLLEPSTGKGTVFEPGNGSETLYELDKNGKKLLEIGYLPYPYDSEDMLLIAIHVYSGDYNILGVSLGDDFEEACEKIEKFDYEITYNEAMICAFKKTMLLLA